MDIELLKSGAEEQMEMMLMMQMDKLSHEFSSGSYSDGSHDHQTTMPPPPMMDFSNNNNNNTAIMAGGHHAAGSSSSSSSCLMNLPSTTISFTTSPHHDQMGIGNSSSSSTTTTAILSHYPHQNNNNNNNNNNKQQHNSVAAMREMIFRIAAMQPIHIDPESVKPPKRRNVKISKDPQSVAARHRRERISERIRILQRLVPGGTKMDTASMLDEAIHYVKFLKNQVQSLERAATTNININSTTRPPQPPLAPPPPVPRVSVPAAGIGFPVPMSSGTYLPMSSATKLTYNYYADA